MLDPLDVRGPTGMTPRQEAEALARMLAGESWRDLAEHYDQPGWNIRLLAVREGERIQALVDYPAKPSDPLRPHADDKPFGLARHPDAEPYDALTVETDERWKTSGLSGDEWRFSYLVTWWRKGMVFWRRSFSRMEWAAASLPRGAVGREDAEVAELAHWLREDETLWTQEAENELCCQPGCALPAAVEYRKVKDWCSRCGQDHVPSYASWDERRRFCLRHLMRGDCGLDDADANYVAVRARTSVVGDPWLVLEPPLPVASPEWAEFRWGTSA